MFWCRSASPIAISIIGRLDPDNSNKCHVFLTYGETRQLSTGSQTLPQLDGVRSGVSGILLVVSDKVKGEVKDISDALYRSRAPDPPETLQEKAGRLLRGGGFYQIIRPELCGGHLITSRVYGPVVSGRRGGAGDRFVDGDRAAFIVDPETENSPAR